MQPMQKLMLMHLNLRAKLNKLPFPRFSLSQLSDFRTTKPQFQSENMLNSGFRNICIVILVKRCEYRIPFQSFSVPPFLCAYCTALTGFRFMLALLLEDIAYHAAVAIDKVMYLV